MGFWKELLGGKDSPALPPGEAKPEPTVRDHLDRLPDDIRLLHVLVVDESRSMEKHAAEVCHAIEEQLAVLRSAEGADQVATFVVTYNDDWAVRLPPSPLLAAPRTIAYEPHGSTNHYASVRDVFRLLLDWHAERNAPDRRCAIMVTLLCDGQHLPDEYRLLERYGLGHLYDRHEQPKGVPNAEGFSRPAKGKLLELIMRERKEVREASAKIVAAEIDVRVIGFGTPGEKIAEDLGLPRTCGSTEARSRQAVRHALESVTSRVREHMEIVLREKDGLQLYFDDRDD
jgi:hypothetical protein